MRLALFVLALGLSVAACKKDEPADPAPAAPVDDGAAARQRDLDEMMKNARDRAENMHDRIDDFEDRLTAAEAKLVVAKTADERKAAQDELRKLKAEIRSSRSSPPPDAGSKAIDIKCANYPLGKCPD